MPFKIIPAIFKKKSFGSGLPAGEQIHYQLSPEELSLQTVQRGEGVLNDTGALIISTGEFTGRSPDDKFIVKDDILTNVLESCY